MLMLTCNQWVAAETYKQRITEGVNMAVEQFQLREFDTSNSVLRSESGQRLGFGYNEDNMGWRHPGIIYDLAARGLLGVVFYHDNNPKPVFDSADAIVSKTDYLGFDMSGMVGQRYGYIAENRFLEIMAGAKLTGVLRNMRNNDDGFGQGVREIRGTVSPRASIALSTWWRGMRQRISVGIKFPVVVRILNLESRTIYEPKGEWGYFANLDMTRLFRLNRRWINVQWYLESTQFKAAQGKNGHVVDRTTEIISGLRLTYDFQ